MKVTYERVVVLAVLNLELFDPIVHIHFNFFLHLVDGTVERLLHDQLINQISETHMVLPDRDHLSLDLLDQRHRLLYLFEVVKQYGKMLL